MMPCNTINILGVPVSVLDMDSLLARLQEMLAAPGCAVAYGVNAHSLNLACQQADFQKALLGMDLIYADGASLLLAARVLGGCLPEKLTTTDIWPHLCQLGVEQGTRFFLLGGEPGLAERARDKALEEYPGLQIVGTHNGYFDLEDETPVKLINAAAPDILWVGMGDPRQALWVEKWRQHLKVKLILTCGGMFKIVSGELDRLSSHWRQKGCEWIYRLWQEPRNWRRYLLGLPAFGLRVLGSRLMELGGNLSNNPPP
ncbi:MAG: WecB/TagA/CpsF family glycosyltransferase [Syntrophales bacterium]|nr:WecB/TagA/CpsF family glycosyltransferase [Syntrophales bacterium]